MPVQPQDKPVTASAITYIENRWRITCKGWRAVGPGGDHPKGLAVDASTSNLQIGNEIRVWALAHPDTRIVIWQGKGSFPAEGGKPRPCTGCAGHYDHVHISFHGNQAYAGITQPVTNTSSTAPMSPVDSTTTSAVDFITNPRNWYRIGLFAMGLLSLALAALYSGATLIGSAVIGRALKVVRKR